MSTAEGAVTRDTTSWLSLAAWRRLLRDQPVIPLVILLAVMVALLIAIQPGILNRPQAWVLATLRFATPLALLAACQTLTMLTGGIDLSVAVVASMSAYVMATQSVSQGDAIAIALAILVAGLVGLLNGVGVGIFRVQPLIMTLGTGLVALGAVNVYQKTVLTAGSTVPQPIQTLGSGNTLGFIPNALLVLVPVALVVMIGLKRTGYGRMLYAVGDNPIAARLAGVRVWQVLLVLYVLSGLLAGIAGITLAGITKTATLNVADSYLLPSVAAAVIGGTSIFGGRGGYAGTILGALILTVLASLLTVLDAPEPIRQIVYGAIILGVAAAYARLTGER
ncbi:MAG: ABC transporter permease [Candidatus Limnocylindrales bacterium]